MPGSEEKFDLTGQKKEKKLPRWWLFFIFFLLAFILIVYYFSEIKKEFALLATVSPYWLLIVFLGQFLTYFFTAFVYFFLLQAYRLQRQPGWWDLLKASVISLFFNQTVPSAGLSGNAFFFNFLGRFDMQRTQIISLILAELLIFYAAMEAVIVFLLAACIFFVHSVNAFKGILIAGIVVYLVFTVAILFASKKNMIARLYDKMKKFRLVKKMLHLGNEGEPGTLFMEKDARLMSLIKNNKPLVIKSFFTQLLVICGDGLTLYALFQGLGFAVSPFIVLLTLISTKIISIIPFLPGSLILYESSMTILFVNAGTPLPTAVIATMLYRLLSFWLPLPIGTLLYRRWIKNNT